MLFTQIYSLNIKLFYLLRSVCTGPYITRSCLNTCSELGRGSNKSDTHLLTTSISSTNACCMIYVGIKVARTERLFILH